MKIKKRLPVGYHTDYNEGKNKFFWYYLGKDGGGKDYSPKRYFSKYEDAKKDAMKHHKLNKNK